MKSIVSQLMRYKTFQKLTISYFLLVLVSVCLLSSVLFTLFSSSTIKEIDNNNKIMLAQISYASDVVYNNITNIGNVLINDNLVVSFLYSNKEDKIKNYELSRLLSKLQNTYPFIHSIGIYRPNTESIVDSSGLPADRSFLGQSSTEYMSFFPRKFTNYNKQLDQFITFTLYPDFSLRTPSNSVIYINVEERYILNTIRNISKENLVDNTFVMDAEGIILSHTDPSFFMQNISNEAYVQKILSENSTNSFTFTIDKQKHLITFVKSDELNWYFVSVTPYKTMISNIHKLRNTTIFIAAILVLLGLLFSIFMTKNVYRPIFKLFTKVKQSNDKAPLLQKVDEYQVINDAFTSLVESEQSMKFVLNRSSRTIAEHYLQTLIKGSTSHLGIPETIAQTIEEQLQGPYFYAIVFKLDNINLIKDKISPSQQPLIRFAVCNIAKEVLETFEVMEPLVTEEDEIVVVGQCELNKYPVGLIGALENIQRSIRTYFKVTASIGIGDIVISRKNLQSSYTSAQQYVRYKLIYGDESILDFHKTESHIMSTINYPISIEKQLVGAIQDGSTAVIGEKSEEFITQISNGSTNQLITYSSQLMLSLLKHFDYIQTLPSVHTNEYLDAISLVENAETLKQISNIIHDYCIKISALIQEKNNLLNAQKHNSIIEEVQKYIHEHYSEPNLSLEFVSSFAGLSSGYLGKLFKGATSMSFSEYLNYTRLEHAKEQLATTNEPAFKISESVGIYNVTYFSTLFKKNYGLSPTQYREQVALKQLSRE